MEAVLDTGRRHRTLYPFDWSNRPTSLRWSPCKTITPSLPEPPVARPFFSSRASFSASSGFCSRPRTTVTAFPYRRVFIPTDNRGVSRPPPSPPPNSFGHPPLGQVPPPTPP